jgi:hypothetical protein
MAMATATVMANGDGDGDGDGNGDGNGNRNGNGHRDGKDDVVLKTTDTREGCLFLPVMCRAGAMPCLPPLDTKECALPSAAPWGCHCKKCLLHFRGRDPDSLPWIV